MVERRGASTGSSDIAYAAPCGAHGGRRAGGDHDGVPALPPAVHNWGTIERIVEWQVQEGTAIQGPAAARDARVSWIAEYGYARLRAFFYCPFADVFVVPLQALIDQVHDQIMKLLALEWLVANVDSCGGTRLLLIEAIRIVTVFAHMIFGLTNTRVFRILPLVLPTC